MPKSIDTLLHSSSTMDMNQSIKDFLSKPVLLQSGVLSSTDSVSTFALQHLPWYPLTLSVYKNKLDGFLGFRATMVLRLTINANRFQQGRYMLCYVPSCGAATNTTIGALRYNSHINTLRARTQLPRIELDLACDTEGTIRIPFNSVQNFYPLRSVTTGVGYGNWGTAQLFPYSPLVSPTGSATAPFMLFIHFEDVELITATVPQSGRMMARKSKSEKEAESQKIGPIQSTLIKVSNAASLFKPVPMISAYAGGLSWLADIGANAASVFGWSKPRNMAAQVKVVRETASGIYHTDVSDVGQSLSLVSRNAVDVLPGFSSTDVDEMDFSFVATIPAWLRTETWSTTDVTGTALFSINTEPLAGRSDRVVTGGVIVTDYSPLSFVTDYFMTWRGSLVYTIKFVKTEFHSGRLAIVFYPSDLNTGTAATSFALSPYAHREIVDIRECNEVTFTVPYISSSPYRSTQSGSANTGVLVVYVVNPLSAPSSVSSSVKMLVEIAGGSDIEFAIPRLNTNAPAMNVTPESGAMKTADVCRIEDTTIGCSATTDDKARNAAACIGEKVSSFRSLLKSTACLTPISEIAGDKFLTIRPFYASVFYNGLVNPYPLQVGDLFSTLTGIYALSRGGVRLKVLTDTSVSNKYPSIATLAHLSHGDATTSTAVWTATATANGGATNIMNRFNGQPLTIMNNGSNYISEFAVPQYNRYHSRATFDNMVNPNIATSTAETTFADKNLVTFFIPGVTTIAQPQVFRGGSDDVNFGVFVSIPPMQKALGFQGTL
jgi:hypothetical protein